MRRFYFALVVIWISANAFAASPDSPCALLRADKFDELEDYYGALFRNYNPKVPNSYLPVSSALNRINYSADLLPHFDKWVAAKPASHVARLMRGDFYIRHAWAARGTGWGSTISRKGGELFHERLMLADTDLTSSTQLNPNSPFPYEYLITIDMAISRGEEIATKHLDSARAIDPSFYPAYRQYMQVLQPRWGGSHQQMFEFAKQYADSVPGSNLPLLWIGYHYDRGNSMYDGREWWKNADNWKQIDEIYKKLIPIQPNPNGLRQVYAELARYCGKREVVAEQLETVGAKWSDDQNVTRVFAYARYAWPDRDPYEWMLAKTGEELSRNPNSTTARMLRGMAYRHLRKYPEALAELSKSVEIDPENLHAWLEIAEIQIRQKNYAGAIDAAEYYLLSHPDSADAVHVKGDALRLSGKLDEAIAFLQETLEVHPSMHRAYYTLGLAQKDNKDYEGVVKTCQRGIYWATQNKDEDTQRNLFWLAGTTCKEMNETEKALGFYTEALKREDGEYMLGVMAELFKEGGVWAPFKERIVKAVETSYKGSDDAAKKQAALARFRRMIATGEEGLKLAQERLSQNPKDQEALIAVTQGYMSGAKQPAMALQACDEFLKNDPQNRRVRAERGRALEALRRHGEALVIYKQLVKEDPAEPLGYNYLSRCLMTMNSRKEALDACDAFFKNCPNAPANIKSAMLARRSQLRGEVRTGGNDPRRFKQASTDIEEAIRLDPTNPNLYYQAAWDNVNNHAKMLEYAQKSVQLRKTPSAVAYSQLGAALERNGRIDEAVAAHNQALKIDPNDAMALSCLKNMRAKGKIK